MVTKKRTCLEIASKQGAVLACQAVFTLPSNMEHPCVTCTQAFRTSDKIMVHQSSHTKERLFSCLYCEKSFSQSGHLKTHKTTHTGEKGYGCIRCGKAFITSQELQLHQLSHTGEKPYGTIVSYTALALFSLS